jgi:hypothetical protein
MSVLPDPGASCAVLIGTSRYEYLEDLPAVSNNLKALAEALAGQACWNLPAERCTVVEDPARPQDVMSAVRLAADRAEDTLLIYFAGHGLVDPQGALSLAVPDTQQHRVETALPYDWLRQVLLESPAERHVVVLDCCYSGLALGRMGGPTDLADHATVEGTFLLAAAAETRTALAPVGATYTAFTEELLHILRHGIPQGPALLELGAVYRRMRTALEGKGRPVPQARDRNSGAGLALGRNQAWLPTSPAAADRSGIPGESRAWPDPTGIRTVGGFLRAFAEVRAVSGLTQRAVSERSAGRISPGTVGSLVNRSDLPARWSAAGAYLSACGLPEDAIGAWHATWQRLRDETAARPSPLTPDEAPRSGGRAKRLWPWPRRAAARGERQ